MSLSDVLRQRCIPRFRWWEPSPQAGLEQCGGFRDSAASLSPRPGCSVLLRLMPAVPFAVQADKQLHNWDCTWKQEWGVKSSRQHSQRAVELWPEDIDWKIEGFRNRALGVLRKEVESKGVCRWNVLKNLLVIRLFSWFFAFFFSCWSFSLLAFIKSPLLLAAF